ncbi:zinc finger CCHC domain-containing protein 2-like isoform X4 [Scyliorhinus canicula]|uniref:zinc finger CCHC domain-containing protein 2-like isoform X4 n=1 Tax=Scyliorhinus canicula TaxID=7830 RepID=UPI0018F2B601|nr:zinc finger CCHC domain-containing protein 2-like isoform X4 [Scyliorhinus canicula]
MPMKMKVLMKLPEPEEEEEEEEEGEAAPAMPPPPPCQPWKEGVYEWFGSALTSAQRLEFCCGLLDLCHPLELRFLGSCLEDLARKDYHSLRDSEIRANSVQELAALGEPADEVTRSRLVVSLALLGSENREAAAVLARALARLDSAVRTCGLPLTERGVQEFLLLLTMASNHPAFSFHHKESLRQQLADLQRPPGAGRNFQTAVCKDRLSRKNYSLGTESNYYERTPPSSCEGAEAIAQRPGVQIENISFKTLSKKRTDNYWEYTFDVLRTDLSRCIVRKTHQELQEFLSKLPKDLCIDASGKTALRALSHGSQMREDRRHSDLELIIRQLFSSPSRAFLKSEHVHEFFLGKLSDCSQHHTNLQPALKLPKSVEHFKEDSSEASSQEEDGQQQSIHHKKNMGKSIGCSISGIKSPGVGVSLQHSEQNGVLDWKKRNYSTKRNSDHCTAVMEHCLSEDKRNTSPGSKKLNTQADNSKNKINRGSHRAPVGNGILRIPPVQHVWTGSGKELRDVGSALEACGDSSSESYSSPSSPRHDGRESCESEDEKDKDSDSTSEDSGKDKQKERISCNPVRGSITRPTAQVAPVQSENCNVPGNPPAPFLPRIPLMPPMHYMMQNGGKKPDYVTPVDNKTVGMIVTVPPVAASLRDSSHVTSVGTAEAGKRMDLIPSPLSVATPFFLQTASPDLHPMAHRHKMTASQINLENCRVPGPQTPAGNVNIGSANTAFIPVHSHSPSGKLSAPSVLDPIAKPSTQNIVGLNALLPQADGNIGTIPESASLKVMLPAAGLLPPPGSYNLSGTPTSVLPLQGTATCPSPVGQIQSTGSSVPTHTPGPVPSLNAALTHSTAQSDSTSYINTIGNTSTNGTMQPAQQLGCGACSSCGCRGSCGTNNNPLLNYYYPNTIPSQLIRVPFIPFSGITSLCNGSYLNHAHQNNGTQMPFYQNPYTNGLMHDPMANQTNYGMQQMPGFVRGFPLMYQVANMVTNVNGLGPKKNGNASCYNCGVGGHYAQDCKQPSMEASQPVDVETTPLSKVDA